MIRKFKNEDFFSLLNPYMHATLEDISAGKPTLLPICAAAARAELNPPKPAVLEDPFGDCQPVPQQDTSWPDLPMDASIDLDTWDPDEAMNVFKIY